MKHFSSSDGKLMDVSGCLPNNCQITATAIEVATLIRMLPVSAVLNGFCRRLFCFVVCQVPKITLCPLLGRAQPLS